MKKPTDDTDTENNTVWRIDLSRDPDLIRLVARMQVLLELKRQKDEDEMYEELPVQ